MLPAESLYYSKITTQIIPAIAHLMKVEPLSMRRLASDVFTMTVGRADIDCTNLKESDDFFEKFALM